MSSCDPAQFYEWLDGVRDHNLCPNRVWQACSQIKDWPSRHWALHTILTTIPKNALQHEDHSACSIDFCEFSTRNFTATNNEIHSRKGVFLPIKNLFSDYKLVRAIESNRPTAWGFDGSTLLKHPRPFMAISHVWSDGTGAGIWPSKQVNECAYRYFQRIAKTFQCEGIWWDTLCVPNERDARNKALNNMHHNYEFARITLVHDRFLRKVPFQDPDSACIAIVLSSWFTRGWTALELAKSRKVRVVFKDSIQDLDRHILDKARETNFAAEAIRRLRGDRLPDLSRLLSTLGSRYTSWLKDRATIAGLLVGIQISFRLVCDEPVSVTARVYAIRVKSQ
ncbi:hypothetical protein F5Y08DRAFT_347347 [Xylaria arbuscula]|nr:hypothetical protein F5Y08DRAFT_347347 [Xylaria arbuscula]